MKHRYKAGQRVRVRADRQLQPAGSASYKIIAALPIERAKSDAETFERVAEEGALSLMV